MSIFLLPDHELVFPHPFLTEEHGALAVSGKIDLDMILLAYRFGIFPWYNPGEPVTWYYLHPRLILRPDKIKVQKSMRSLLNGNRFSLTYDTCFHDVLIACKEIERHGHKGSWIHQIIESSFLQLHEMGYAHSVECWEGEELVGGLYGLSIGKVFFGESMFAKKSNASKFALIKLAEKLKTQGYTMIDCQQDTPHLRSLGAELISKEQFMQELKLNVLHPDIGFF